jgi:hypothetical protein
VTRTSHKVILPPHLDDGAVGPLGLEEEYGLGEPRLQREVHGVHQQRRGELAELVPQQRLVVSAAQKPGESSEATILRRAVGSARPREIQGRGPLTA